MQNQQDFLYKIYEKAIIIQCPICNYQKKLNIPFNVIKQSLNLTTLSIPSGLVCEHSFQAYIDKNFKIRGYQKVDFDFSTIELYEEYYSENPRETKNISTSELPFLQDIIALLRNHVDGKDILGSALFTIEGKIIYSSLALETLYHTIREFETRNEKHLLQIKKILLILENNQKVFSQFININGMSLIITLLYPSTVQLGMSGLFLKDLIKKIEKLEIE